MYEFYGMAVFCVSAAVAAVMRADAALQVIGHAGVEGLVAASDNVDEPGHRVNLACLNYYLEIWYHNYEIQARLIPQSLPIF